MAIAREAAKNPVNLILIHFSELPDPRLLRGRRHVLWEILTMAILAVICGADGWVQVEQFAQSKRRWLQRFMELPHGIPSHDTFGRIFAALDARALERCFLKWVASLSRLSGKLVSLDGKSIRRSFEHSWDKSGMSHLVSAFVGANRLVLGQMASTGSNDDQQRRGNEITAIPKLLELLELKGATVSIDAIGTQRAIARKIRQREADYVLCVKENQPQLHRAVKRLLDEAILENFSAPDMPGDYFEEVDGDHGRIETRRVWHTDQVQYLNLAEAWPDLRSIVAVERVREILGKDGVVKKEQERHYYISSIAGRDARRMAEAIRGHWGIENQLHWHLDVSFGEDARRVRKGNGAQNFSRLCRIALNLLQQDRSLKVGVKTRRLRAGWDHDYLLKLLTG